MQHATVERRTRRVPLSVMIELEHESFPRPFEADGVNLGLGGLALEAPYMPAVGDKMRCRFASPSGGRRVEADCEVVWAEDRGPSVGQFGLRFRDLDSASAEAILNIVRRPEGIPLEERRAAEATTVPGTIEAPAVGPESERHAVADDHAGHPVTLYLDGMPTPAVARVQQQLPGGVLLEQELGFFKIGSGLEVKNGCRRRGRIASLDLRIEETMPKLVLEIAYEDGSLDTIPDLEPPALDDDEPSGEGIEASAYEDEDLDEAAHFDSLASVTFEAPESVLHAAAIAEVERLHDEEASSAPISSAASVVERARPKTEEELVERAPSPVITERPRRLPLALFRARFSVALEALRTYYARALVTARSAVTRMRLATVEWKRRYAGRTSRPRTSTARVTARFFSLLGSRLGARVGRSRPAPRRTTAPPPGVSKASPRKVTTPSKSESEWADRARVLLLAFLAFGGAAAAVYALSPSNADEDLPPVPAAVATPPPAPAAAIEAPLPEPAPTEEGELAPAPLPELPPSTLSNAVRPTAPGSVPSDSPYAADVREAKPSASVRESEGAVFGDADVPNGKTHLLRMSQPVASIRGTSDERGFTIVVSDSLSLDRAGPIASSHPEVERAMILNRGDHAELVVRFVAGKKPPFRVAARGRAIEVTIGKP